MNGDQLNYTFSQTAGTTGTITVDSQNPAKATFVAPSVRADETVTIQVTVNDNKGAEDSATVNIAVKNILRPSTLVLNSITSVPWGKDVTVSGKLTTVDENESSVVGVGDATITFDGTGTSKIASTTTNPDGTFTAKGASPSSVATKWTAQAHFAGNADYRAANSLLKTYSTTKHSTAQTLSLTPSSVAAGQSYNVGTTLKDSTANVPLAGKTITFTADSPITVSDQTTDSLGKSKATLKAPSTAGTYNIKAQFATETRSIYLT